MGDNHWDKNMKNSLKWKSGGEEGTLEFQELGAAEWQDLTARVNSDRYRFLKVICALLPKFYVILIHSMAKKTRYLGRTAFR